MATWLSLNAADLPIIGDIDDIAGELEAPLNAAATAATAAAAVMGTLSGLVAGATDPLGLVRSQIDDLISDLIASGVYGLVVSPDLYGRGRAVGVDGFLQVVKTSMQDQGDPNRPAFSPGDTSTGVIFMVSSPSLALLASIADRLQKLFGGLWTEVVNFAASIPAAVPASKFEATGTVTSLVVGEDSRLAFIDETQGFYATQMTYDPYKGQRMSALSGQNVGQWARIESFDNETRTFRLSPGFRYPLEVGDAYAISYDVKSQPPDWQSYRVIDAVPIVADAVGILSRVRDLIPISGAGAQFDALAALLSQKATLLSTLAAQVSSLIDFFDTLDDVTGIHMLPVAPQNGGNPGFMFEAYAAENPPEVGSDDYTLGIVLYGGSGVYATLQKVFPLP